MGPALKSSGPIWRAGLLAAWGVFALAALWGTHAVPFHPDEATFLYMSRDFDLLLHADQPTALNWQAAGQPALVRRYRLLDAPLGRFLAGLGRTLAGEPPLAQDWDWSAGWATNAAVGALPSTRALTAARLPGALLSALSVVLVYQLGHQLGGRPTAILAALVFGFSGLLLLHGRRAMSEGALLFFSLLTLWLLLRPRPQPLLAGLALAAAIAAKLSAVALLPAALLALALPVGHALTLPAWRAPVRQWAFFAVALALGLWVLHPSLWVAPWAGLQAMGAARETFFAGQAAFFESVAPHVRLAQPGLRALSLVYHVYFAPPAFADVGQYAAATAPAEQQYTAMLLNQGWHTRQLSFNLVLGGLLLGLTLIGLLQPLLTRWASARAATTQRALAPASQASRAWRLLAVATLSLFAGLLTVAVPYQRYYMPLLPLAALWAAHGCVTLLQPLRRLAPAAVRRPLPSHD